MRKTILIVAIAFVTLFAGCGNPETGISTIDDDFASSESAIEVNTQAIEATVTAAKIVFDLESIFAANSIYTVVLTAEKHEYKYGCILCGYIYWSIGEFELSLFCSPCFDKGRSNLLMRMGKQWHVIEQKKE